MEKPFNKTKDFSKFQFSVVVERNNQVISARKFPCDGFNYRTINTTIPCDMLEESLLVVEDMLKEKSVDYTWNTTNLYRDQDPNQMQVSIDWFAKKPEDILKLSFYQGKQLIVSGSIDLNNYPSQVREIIDMTGQKTEGGGKDLYAEIIEIFQDYMTEREDLISIEDKYNVPNKFPRIHEHYRAMIEKKNVECKQEMSYI